MHNIGKFNDFLKQTKLSFFTMQLWLLQFRKEQRSIVSNNNDDDDAEMHRSL